MIAVQPSPSVQRSKVCAGKNLSSPFALTVQGEQMSRYNVDRTFMTCTNWYFCLGLKICIEFKRYLFIGQPQTSDRSYHVWKVMHPVFWGALCRVWLFHFASYHPFIILARVWNDAQLTSLEATVLDEHRAFATEWENTFLFHLPVNLSDRRVTLQLHFRASNVERHFTPLYSNIWNVSQKSRSGLFRPRPVAIVSPEKRENDLINLQVWGLIAVHLRTRHNKFKTRCGVRFDIMIRGLCIILPCHLLNLDLLRKLQILPDLV